MSLFVGLVIHPMVQMDECIFLFLFLHFKYSNDCSYNESMVIWWFSLCCFLVWVVSSMIRSLGISFWT